MGRAARFAATENYQDSFVGALTRQAVFALLVAAIATCRLRALMGWSEDIDPWLRHVFGYGNTGLLVQTLHNGNADAEELVIYYFSTTLLGRKV